MPLSDEEQRLLEQMERALVEEDPKFASTLRGTRFARATRARLVVSGVVFVLGVAVLMTGVILRGSAASQAAIGVVGFVLMLASATVGLTAWRNRQATTDQENREAAEESGEDGRTAPGGLSLIQGGRTGRKPKSGPGRKSRPSKRSSGTFMQRMEARWQRRRGTGGF